MAFKLPKYQIPINGGKFPLSFVPAGRMRGIGLCNIGSWAGVSNQSIWPTAWALNNDTSRASLCANTTVPLRGVYKNANGAKTDQASSVLQSTVASWEASNGGSGGFLRNGSGTIIPYQTTVQMVDPANSAITDLIITAWDTDATCGLNGYTGINFVFIDNVGLDVRQFDDNSANGTIYNSPIYTGADPSLTPSTAANAWARASQTKYAKLAAHLQQKGIFVTGNCLGFQGGASDGSMYTSTLAWWNTCLRFPTNNTLGPGSTPWRPGEPIFDAYAVEYWVVHWNSTVSHNRLRSDQGTADFRDYWGERVDLMDIVGNFTTNGKPTPRAFFGLTEGSHGVDALAGRYARASFLLKYRGDYSAAVLNAFGDTTVANVGNGEIGQRNGDPYEVDAAWVTKTTFPGKLAGNFVNTGGAASAIVADYSNGQVVVNATKNSITFTAGPFNGTTLVSGDAIIHVGQ